MSFFAALRLYAALVILIMVTGCSPPAGTTPKVVAAPLSPPEPPPLPPRVPTPAASPPEVPTPSFAPSAAPAPAQPARPLPPAGFSWKEFPQIQGVLLVPDGWHVKVHEEKGTIAVFITEQNIDERKKYDVGLSAQVVKRLEGSLAVDRAKAYIANLALQNELVELRKPVSMGKLEGHGCLIKAKALDGSGTLVMSSFALGNTKTNSLFLFTFEAPESKWEEAWKKGMVIMNKLGVDDEF